jgi:hypothetical protein
MPSNYDKIDLEWTWNGDFNVGRDGDLADTESDQIQSLIQEIQTVAQSALDDWAEHPSLGAGIDDFVGEANSRETARKIESRLEGALTLNNIVRDEDLNVRVVPIGPHTILVTITVEALATQNNSLENNTVTTTVVFDYFERGVVFVEG